MSVNENEVLVKITSAGTISIPKQFRKYMDIQKGEYISDSRKRPIVGKKSNYFLIYYCCFWAILMV